MALSLSQVLATLPGGQIVQPLSLGELGRYLREHVATDAENEREKQHRLADDLYRDGGLYAIHALLDSVYKDPEIRDRRKAWAPYARFDNLTKRIVNESSTIYQEPAVRRVGGDEANQARYQMALALCGIHERARWINRMLNLHRALWVAPRVQDLGEGRRRPVIDVVTPANCRLILHPNDRGRIVGVATRLRPRTYSAHPEVTPAWVVWSEAERFMVNAAWEILGPTWQPHSLGRIPGVFVSLEAPSDDSPWPGTCGSDLTNADVSIWFTAVSLLKEVKSATRQTAFAGDLSGLARGQSSDSEGALEVPEGVSVTSVDMSMDLAQFRDTANHIRERVANNYGMSGALMSHQGTQSAEARELMRVPLRELRREQQTVMRAFERELAEVMAVVFAADMPEIGFDPAGWSIDFGEAQTPLSAKEELERFEHESRLCLTNPIDYLMSLNPDLTEDQAREAIERNVAMKLWQNLIMRPLMAVSGAAMGGKAPQAGDAPAGEAAPSNQPANETEAAA